jgi:general secretion pathway protein G
MMVVIVIIGMLAGAVTVSVRSYLVRSKQNVAKMEISKICEAIEMYYSEYSRYPSNSEGIAILAAKSEAFTDGLLSKVPTDPWGNEYEYNSPGPNAPYQVLTYGADGQEGGDGDNSDIDSDTLGS